MQPSILSKNIACLCEPTRKVFKAHRCKRSFPRPARRCLRGTIPTARPTSPRKIRTTKFPWITIGRATKTANTSPCTRGISVRRSTPKQRTRSSSPRNLTPRASRRTSGKPMTRAPIRRHCAIRWTRGGCGWRPRCTTLTRRATRRMASLKPSRVHRPFPWCTAPPRR